MVSFKIRGTEYILRFSFLLFNALVFLLRDGELIASFYAVCLIHETGHILAVILTDGRVKKVEFTGIGIKMISTPPISLKNGLFVLFSGPAVNIILFAVLKLYGFSGIFSLLNLYEGIFNLLPFDFLDGGAAFSMVIEGSTHETFWRKILFIMQIAVISAVIILLK